MHAGPDCELSHAEVAVFGNVRDYRGLYNSKSNSNALVSKPAVPMQVTLLG